MIHEEHEGHLVEKIERLTHVFSAFVLFVPFVDIPARYRARCLRFSGRRALRLIPAARGPCVLQNLQLLGG